MKTTEEKMAIIDQLEVLKNQRDDLVQDIGFLNQEIVKTNIKYDDICKEIDALVKELIY